MVTQIASTLDTLGQWISSFNHPVQSYNQFTFIDTIVSQLTGKYIG
jgi:hypothetical protein